MESTQPARRTAATPAAPEGDRRAQEKAAKEQTDKEIAERIANPPEPPTPTQAEADALKSGEALSPETRDVKPGASGAGYTTR
jgi:hypothetical protein